MSSRGRFLTVFAGALFAGALVLATASHAADMLVLATFDETVVTARNWPAGRHGAALRWPSGITSPADSEVEQPGEPAQGETKELIESDWLTSPPDPKRHNLWVPTAEWTTCLVLTIPLFMIDPSFVNVGTLSSDTFGDAWTRPPEWDTDGAVSNYILHPVMGAEAYLSLRNRDYGPFGSFLFSTGVSFGWEYLIEAWVERPSAQDLIITSNIGSLLGEARFQMRRRIARWSPSAGRDALLILIDPFEALHRYIGKEFLHRPKDATDETVGSSLNFGPDQARVMMRLQF
jgi:hypothetical protein